MVLRAITKDDKSCTYCCYVRWATLIVLTMGMPQRQTGPRTQECGPDCVYNKIRINRKVNGTRLSKNNAKLLWWSRFYNYLNGFFGMGYSSWWFWSWLVIALKFFYLINQTHTFLYKFYSSLAVVVNNQWYTFDKISKFLVINISVPGGGMEPAAP